MIRPTPPRSYEENREVGESMSKAAQLGETIRDRRLALGYSLGQLATKVSKTASSIRSWEKGEQIPTEEEAAALAAALDLDAATLVALRPDSKVWAEGESKPVDVNDPWNGGDAAGESHEAGNAGTRSSDDQSAEPVDSLHPAETAKPTEDVTENRTVEPGSDSSNPVPQSNATIAAAAETMAVARPEPPWPAPARSTVHEALTTEAAPSLAGDAGPQAVPSAMHEAMTEAVPVVPVRKVPVLEDRDPGLAGATAEPVGTASNPLLTVWDRAVEIYHDIFDPSRRWIYRVRFVLLVIAFLIMLRVLVWAGGNLLDAIGEVLDSFSFSPAETPDVQN